MIKSDDEMNEKPNDNAHFSSVIQKNSAFIEDAEDYLREKIDQSNKLLPSNKVIENELKALEQLQNDLKHFISILNNEEAKTEENKKLIKNLEKDIVSVNKSMSSYSKTHTSAQLALESMKELKVRTKSYNKEMLQMPEVISHIRSVQNMVTQFIKENYIQNVDQYIYRRPNVYLDKPSHLDLLVNVYLKNLSYLKNRCYLCVGCWSIIQIGTGSKDMGLLKAYSDKSYPLFIKLTSLVDTTFFNDKVPRKIYINDLIYFLLNSEHIFFDDGVKNYFVPADTDQGKEEYFPFPTIGFWTAAKTTIAGETKKSKSSPEVHGCINKTNRMLKNLNFTAEENHKYRWENILDPKKMKMKRFTPEWISERLNIIGSSDDKQIISDEGENIQPTGDQPENSNAQDDKVNYDRDRPNIRQLEYKVPSSERLESRPRMKSYLHMAFEQYLADDKIKTEEVPESTSLLYVAYDRLVIIPASTIKNKMYYADNKVIEEMRKHAADMKIDDKNRERVQPRDNNQTNQANQVQTIDNSTTNVFFNQSFITEEGRKSRRPSTSAGKKDASKHTVKSCLMVRIKREN